MIQQGINQLLSMGMVAARLDPNLETRKEFKNLSEKEKILQKQYESIGEAGLWDYDEDTEGIEQNVLADEAELAQKKFELRPNEKTLSQYKEKLKESRQFADKQDMLRKAMAHMQDSGTAKVKQKNSFNKLRESLMKDATFSRLGASAQDYIAKVLAKENKNE